MERLLHYLWKHKILPLQPLATTDGMPVEVIDAGLYNDNAGPDFFNAKLKIGGMLWVGNVEIHVRASDWMRHGHHHDKAYDSVILHVVSVADCAVCRTNGELLPQLVLSYPEETAGRYRQLCKADFFPPCYEILSSLPKLKIHSWLSALQTERFEQKTTLIKERLARCNQHWEDVFFITLARNFGFGLNGDAFEAWASRLPLRAVDKHRDNLFQVEAFFFGQAGLLEEEMPDEYYRKLQKEYSYLRHKFGLPSPVSSGQWKLLRLRPGNFPHVRLAQLAAIYHRQQSLFSRIMEAESVETVRKVLSAETSSYWNEHFTFRKLSPKRVKRLGAHALDLVIINTVVPFLYAYGMHKSNEELPDRATRFLESLKAEDNRIVRLWSNVGLPVSTAADSQALIQLQKAYCDKRECLHCRFGYEYLRGSSI